MTTKQYNQTLLQIITNLSEGKDTYDPQYGKHLNTAVKQVLMAVKASTYKKSNINQQLKEIVKALADYRINNNLN